VWKLRKKKKKKVLLSQNKNESINQHWKNDLRLSQATSQTGKSQNTIIINNRLSQWLLLLETDS
jgi:hypothetical protein